MRVSSPQENEREREVVAVCVFIREFVKGREILQTLQPVYIEFRDCSFLGPF